MTQRYNLTVSNLIRVRAVGVSYQLTLVPAQSLGGSTTPFSYLTDEELKQALFSLGLTESGHPAFGASRSDLSGKQAQHFWPILPEQIRGMWPSGRRKQAGSPAMGGHDRYHCSC